MQNQEKDNRWFVLTVRHNRILKMVRHFKENNIKCFVPMKRRHVVRQGKMRNIEVPAIYNMLFIHSSPKSMEPHLQEHGSTIHLMLNKSTKKPIVIPPDEMKRFMLIACSGQEDLIYMNDDIEKFREHDRVRVTGGYFENFEGYVVRIRRDRKLVVSIQGVVAVAISNIHPSLLIKIDD